MTSSTTNSDQNGVPKRIEAVVVSCQHSESVAIRDLREEVKEKIILQAISPSMVDDDTKFYIDNAAIGEDEKRMIFSENAKRVFPRLRTESVDS